MTKIFGDSKSLKKSVTILSNGLHHDFNNENFEKSNSLKLSQFNYQAKYDGGKTYLQHTVKGKYSPQFYFRPYRPRC